MGKPKIRPPTELKPITPDTVDYVGEGTPRAKFYANFAQGKLLRKWVKYTQKIVFQAIGLHTGRYMPFFFNAFTGQTPRVGLFLGAMAQKLQKAILLCSTLQTYKVFEAKVVSMPKFWPP